MRWNIIKALPYLHLQGRWCFSLSIVDYFITCPAAADKKLNLYKRVGHSPIANGPPFCIHVTMVKYLYREQYLLILYYHGGVIFIHVKKEIP